MMSAEGIGIVLTALGLFITLNLQARKDGEAFGAIKATQLLTVQKLEEMDKENKEGHIKIFDCQKETDVKVGMVEQHLKSINGSMQHHTTQIEALEKDSHPQ